MKTIIAMTALAFALGGCRQAKQAPLEIVRCEVTGTNGKVNVRGQIHNPRATPARSVMVSVEILLDDYRPDDATQQKMKPVTARIDYLPAGATVEFKGSASYPAPDDYQTYLKGKATVSEAGGGIR